MWGYLNNSDFIQIYRDLLSHPSVVSSPPSYRCVLYTLLQYVCFAPCQQDDHGVLIDLKPGQFMCSIRHLAELANVGRKDVEHALDKFARFQIVGQEVRHRKSIFTILWGIKFDEGGTTSGTKVGQVRDIKEDIVVVSSSMYLKEQQQQSEAPTIFECLKKIDILQKDKEKITKKYLLNEKIVEDALECILHPNFVPEVSFLKSLYAACKGEWKPQPNNTQDVKKNYAFAKKLEILEHAYKFEALKDGLQIIMGSKSILISYKKPHQTFVNEVKKIGKIKEKA